MPKVKVTMDIYWDQEDISAYDVAEVLDSLGESECVDIKTYEVEIIEESYRKLKMEIDWKRKLMQMLNCFSFYEGTWYEGDWEKFGITKKEAQEIEKEYDIYKGRDTSIENKTPDRE